MPPCLLVSLLSGRYMLQELGKMQFWSNNNEVTFKHGIRKQEARDLMKNPANYTKQSNQYRNGYFFLLKMNCLCLTCF